MNCSLPGSSIHGILQARVLEWVAISFSRGSSQPRDQTLGSHIAGKPNFTYGHHQIVNNKIRLIAFFATKDGEALYSQQKQEPGLTDSDHQSPIAKYRLDLKKVGETTKQFRYDLNSLD